MKCEWNKVSGMRSPLEKVLKSKWYQWKDDNSKMRLLLVDGGSIMLAGAYWSSSWWYILCGWKRKNHFVLVSCSFRHCYCIMQFGCIPKMLLYHAVSVIVAFLSSYVHPFISMTTYRFEIECRFLNPLSYYIYVNINEN